MYAFNSTKSGSARRNAAAYHSGVCMFTPRNSVVRRTVRVSSLAARTSRVSINRSQASSSTARTVPSKVARSAASTLTYSCVGSHSASTSGRVPFETRNVVMSRSWNASMSSGR